MWVVTPLIGQILGSLLKKVSHQMTIRILWRRLNGRWLYPPIGEDMEAAGLDMIEVYIN